MIWKPNWRHRLFYTEDTGGGDGGGDSTAMSALSNFSTEGPGVDDQLDQGDGTPPMKLEGDEVRPDFSSLINKSAKKEEEKQEPETKKDDKTTAEPAKEQKKPAKEAKKTTEAKPKEETPAKGKEEAKPADKAPEDDADIEAWQPRKDASSKVVESIGEMKKGWKAERAARRQAEAELANIRQEFETVKGQVGKLPPEVEQELTGLRNFSLLFNAENDPNFRREYDTKIKEADERLIGHLKARQLGEDHLKEIQEAAEKGNIEAWPHWGALVGHETDPIARRQLEDLFMGQRAAREAKHSQLQKLSQDREGWTKQQEERYQQEQQKFASAIRAHAEKFVSDKEWAIDKEVPANASKEVKAAIEAHNAEVGKIGGQFTENIKAMYVDKNPERMAELAFAEVRATRAEKALESEGQARQAAEDRVKELEERLSKVKNAGRIAHQDSSATEVKAPTTTGIGGDARESMHNFFAGKR